MRLRSAALVLLLAAPVAAAPHLGHTGYAARWATGRSIGSRRVEGSREPVIGRRRKPTGARWQVRRAERMATRCAVHAGEQWDADRASKA